VQIRKTPTFGAWSPILKDLASDPQFTKSDFFGPSFASQASEAMKGFKLFPYSPKFDQEMSILIGYLDQYLSGTKSLEEALSGAERDMKNQLSNALQS
jgi:maltose-binding protein MalE